MSVEAFEEIQYDKTSSINPFSLIAEVKKHQILYNKHAEDYENSESKNQVWERIHAVLFPNYEELSEDIKDIIKITVRKRWKSLRDALVKDHRLRGEDPAYARKDMSMTVKEMQFLTPFIKYPRRYIEEVDASNSPDFCKLMNDTTIDLTYQEEQEHEETCLQTESDDIVNNEALYPAVHLMTSEAESEDVDWNKEYCISTPDNYNQGTLNYTIREVSDSEQTENYKKRKRTESEEDLHIKLSELIDRCNEESHDEDRMFLLSLLSDFKRVPVNKKLKVKSAFVTALYEALD